MRIAIDAEGNLLLRSDRKLLSVLLLTLAIVVPAAVLTAESPARDDAVRFVIGVIVAPLFLFFSASVVSSRTVVFDRRTRTAHWSDKRLFGTRSGALSFDSVRAVTALPESGLDENRSRPRVWFRPALLTDEAVVPLTDERSLAAADWEPVLTAVRDFLRIPAAHASWQRDARLLRNAGARVQALALVRAHTGVSLSEAVGILDSLSAD